MNKKDLELITKFDRLRQEVRREYYRLIYLSRQAKRLSDELDEIYYSSLTCLRDDDGGMNVSAMEKIKAIEEKLNEGFRYNHPKISKPPQKAT